MRTEKNRRKAFICRSDGVKKDVNFFLSPFAEEHSGKELILDIMNSEAPFVPLEDIKTNEILFLNKHNIIFVEVGERDLTEETMMATEIRVQMELTNGDVLNGSFFLEMPQNRSRVSDYINFSPDFIYLCREEGDMIINKSFVVSVRDEDMRM